MIHSVAALIILSMSAVSEMDKKVEQVRYLRPAKGGWEPECTFAIRRPSNGWEIRSQTDRGATRLTVTARYDAADRLQGAECTLAMNDTKQTITVEVTQGKARLKNAAGETKELDVPAGVIVTSAPDWTDTFLLCRRFDRKKAGQQAFPGLWIHPKQQSGPRTFQIERLGSDSIQHADRKIELDRYRIELRPGSQYLAWAEPNGTMIRLIPLPYKDGAVTGLVLEGFEKSATSLRPPP